MRKAVQALSLAGLALSISTSFALTHVRSGAASGSLSGTSSSRIELGGSRLNIGTLFYTDLQSTNYPKRFYRFSLP